MNEQDVEPFNKILKSTYKMFNRSFDASMFEIWWEILEPYGFKLVCGAFTKHLATTRFAPVPADILECLPNPLGHPEPEEAWNRAPKSDTEAGYLTDEISRALGSAEGSLNQGNYIAARLAFIESYKKILAEVKAQQKPAKFWYQGASICSHEQRLLTKEQKTIEAAELGWLTPERTLNVLELVCIEQDKDLGPLRERLLKLPGSETIQKALQIENGSSKTESQSKEISESLSLISTAMPSEKVA